ncbi:serpin B10-like [Sitophilus oryzae]|uniref:Serpin B10-like n=1 Tax=Sitophilus oryzae TaxID=7048 RepID=A0A6J2YUU0_SITOR|nr:serpin B10-like [Sitophilus oryzae]
MARVENSNSNRNTEEQQEQFLIRIKNYQSAFAVNFPNTEGFNRNFRRVRSVPDYVFARYYEHNSHYIPPHKRPYRPYYRPEEPLTFAAYGKYQEPGVNFMKYDTVLPFYFVPNLNALALSFPLDNTKYYLLLLLPVDFNGVDQLICDLRLHGNLRFILENLRLTHVIATIPSFTLKGYVTLTPTLQQLGIRRIFEPRQADFSPMTNVTDIYVTNIEQAVTVTIRNYLDPSAENYKNLRRYPPVQFRADHPFLYFVMDTELNVALMVGKVVNPLNSRIR